MLNKKERVAHIVDTRIKAGNYRYEIDQFIPKGSVRILEYGFGDASLLLGLERDKDCKEMYGIEINPSAVKAVEDLLTKTWLIDLNSEDAWLEPEFENYFNYIVAPMSLEHTYDPWYVLKKFNKYIAPEGKLIVQTPNIQCWSCLYHILTGDFPYVSGGTWDFTHIRWYTLKSLIDISFVAGFELQAYMPQMFHPIDLTHLQKKKKIKTLRLPPPELKLDTPPIDIVLPYDIKSIYPLFLAHALVLVLKKTREPEDYLPTPAGGYLESYRLNTPNPLASLSSLIGHPIVPSTYDLVRKKTKQLKATLANHTPSKTT